LKKDFIVVQSILALKYKCTELKKNNKLKKYFQLTYNIIV